MAAKRWEEKIDVKAPADKVWPLVSDFTRHGEWAGHGLQATKTSDGAVGVGTTYATTAKQFGTQKEQRNEQPRELSMSACGRPRYFGLK